MEQVCRRMADAFLDYEMTGKNLGMCEHLDREHFYRFTRGYFELAARNGTLYSAGDNQQGYFIFETPETKGNLYGSLLQMKWMLKEIADAMTSAGFTNIETFHHENKSWIAVRAEKD